MPHQRLNLRRDYDAHAEDDLLHHVERERDYWLARCRKLVAERETEQRRVKVWREIADGWRIVAEEAKRHASRGAGTRTARAVLLFVLGLALGVSL